jgi:hypothetical protein
MDETAIVGENVEVIETTGGATLSWSAAIAGALAAIGITFIVISLGAGIGLAISSPFGSGPSAGTMTIAGAVWLVLAQSLGFAAGGFVAGRTRLNIGAGPVTETKFRDGANGFLAWVIAAAVTVAAVTAIGAAGIAASGRAGTAAVGQAAQSVSSDQLNYFVDSLVRTTPPRGTNGVDVDQAQIIRILANAIREGQLSSDDKSYLASLVQARAGVSPDEAQRRVDDVINRARDTVKQTADTARKAAAFLSFWTFMSMLFGAVAATLGGILGGELRDESVGSQAPALMSR